MEFGQIVSFARKRSGLTLEQAAKAAKIRKSLLENIEAGRTRYVGRERVGRISKALEIDPDYLQMKATCKGILAAEKIKTAFPEIPEGRLCYEIVRKALIDYARLSQGPFYESAKHYLTGDIPHASICGVDPIWIKRICRKIGLELPQ